MTSQTYRLGWIAERYVCSPLQWCDASWFSVCGTLPSYKTRLLLERDTPFICRVVLLAILSELPCQVTVDRVSSDEATDRDSSLPARKPCTSAAATCDDDPGRVPFPVESCRECCRSIVRGDEAFDTVLSGEFSRFEAGRSRPEMCLFCCLGGWEWSIRLESDFHAG